MDYGDVAGGALHRHRTQHNQPRQAFDARAYPHAIPVDEGIFLITPTIRTFAMENTLLIHDDVTVLFDTGLPYEQAAELRDVVDLIVNTHAHLGHTGKNYLFPEVWAFEGEADVVEDFERAVAFHGILGLPVETQWREMLAGLGIGPTKKVARRFAAGDVLDFGRTRWHVLLTPGHSPGHCCFYEPNLGLLYAGDVNLASFGPWYATPGSDIDPFKDSLRRLMPLDLRVVATSARGPMREGIRERLQAFYDCFEQRDQRLLGYLRQPHALAEIVDRLLIFNSFGRRAQYADLIRFQERIMIEKHLTALLAAGRVTCADGVYRASG